MSQVPISLIIDDGSPANTFYFHRLYEKHELLVPTSFTREFAQTCRRHGLKGKFSVVPMPGCLGRLDQGLNRVPQQNVDEFLQVCRQEIMPAFSITPEILTHFLAYNLQSGGFMNLCEDRYIAGLNAEEIAAYVGLALQILDNLGLDPSGVTSPWHTGKNNEGYYAAGIGMAFKQTLNKNQCFYFLHGADGPIKKPTVVCDSERTGTVVSIPYNTGSDPFWELQYCSSAAKAKDHMLTKIDELLSDDGRSGIIRRIFETGLPIVLITHWQTLFCDGKKFGLRALDCLAERINRVFGNQVQWQSFCQLAGF